MISQVRNNPTKQNAKQTINVFFGLDKTTYEFYSDFNGTGFNEITATVNDNDVELTPIFPPPPDTTGFDPATFEYSRQQQNPALAKLLDPNMVTMFTPDEQKQITDMFMEVVNGTVVLSVSPEHPNSIALSVLPSQLSHMISYTGFDEWHTWVK